MPRLSRRAAVVGVSGLALTSDEAALFRRHRPVGAILFARNVADPEQLRTLTDDLRQELGAEAPILVDQEGGRVARLRPPHWPEFPPAARFEGHPDAAEHDAERLGGVCLAAGLNVVCAPVLDLRLPEGHAVIGDRAYSADPAEVARIGSAVIAGLRAAGCVPVIKHVPGHGRATADSHLSLPRVTAGREELEADLYPFRAVCAADGGRGLWAMTAHILYEALDPTLPATLSPRILGGVVRGVAGFQGVLVSDDLAMRALTGALPGLANAAIGAGCDLVLHCTGVLEENAALLTGCPSLSDEAAERMEAARAVCFKSRRSVSA